MMVRDQRTAVYARSSSRPLGRLLFAVLLMVTALLQATFFPATGLIGIVPDFALVFLLIRSATHGVSEGLVWAAGLGFWIDLLTMDPLGTHVLALIPVALIGGVTGGKLFRSGAILPILTVLAATLTYSLVLVILSAMGGDPVGGLGAFRLAIVTSLLNALLVPLSYGVLLVFDRWIPRRV
ncbi:MAG TPA: rod shape-determining protein MreD [Thermomicrobiales bacterium]|nr:rod shape-determining protein MreD [Thermomicrobiales bacterium]